MTNTTPPPTPPAPAPAPAWESYTPAPSGPETTIDQPFYGASFWTAFTRYWTKYATFSGRASRSEFWWADLGNGIIFLVLYLGLLTPGIVIAANGGSPALLIIGGILVGLFGLAVIIPSYALLWRRLHDANLAGPLALLTLVPSLGGLWGIAIGFLPPKRDGERFDAR